MFDMSIPCSSLMNLKRGLLQAAAQIGHDTEFALCEGTTKQFDLLCDTRIS